KGIFPFRAAYVQERDLFASRLEQQEGIVIHRHIPEISVRVAIDFREIAEEPAGRIDQMGPLIDQLTATRARWVGTPFAVVSNAAAMPVTRAQKHQITQWPTVHQFARVT